MQKRPVQCLKRPLQKKPNKLHHGKSPCTWKRALYNMQRDPTQKKPKTQHHKKSPCNWKRALCNMQRDQYSKNENPGMYAVPK